MSRYTIEDGYQKDKRRHFRVAVAFVILTTGVFGYVKLHRNTPDVAITQSVAAQNSQQPRLNTPIAWPKYGQAAYGVAGPGVLAVSDDGQQPVPVASLAKVITALTVLKQKPLLPGQQGPMITLTQADIASYEAYVAKSGAVVPIQNGEQISQYQALQAMLMPSANNMADSLARWAFGSVEQYNAAANQMVKELGLTQTTVADASGFSPATKSTAHDMVQLGILYMQNPVLKGIAAQTEANIPFAGLVRNYNAVSNKDGILGLKVGNTDEAGRCYLAADIRADTKEVVSVVAVIGADHLETAMKDAKIVLKDGNSGYDRLSNR